MPLSSPGVAPEAVEDAVERMAQGPLYQVIIHNDDLTPMDFVLHILTTIFDLAGPHAVQIMYTAHYHGSAYVQSLPRPEAVRRIGLAHTAARLNHYPLKFTMEAEK